MELLVKDLSIGYQQPLCKDISLTLKPGEIHLLLGNNGLGKTTFLKTLCGIVPPLKGEIIFPKTNTAFVGTARPQVEFLTVQEFWEFGIPSYEPNLAASLSKEFGIEELLSSPIQQLSDGQFKKVSLIRQLLKKPNLLLLDEPTAYLDLENKTFLGNFLTKNKDQYLVLLSTHDLHFAASFGTKFYQLSNQKLMEIEKESLHQF